MMIRLAQSAHSECFAVRHRSGARLINIQSMIGSKISAHKNALANDSAVETVIGPTYTLCRVIDVHNAKTRSAAKPATSQKQTVLAIQYKHGDLSKTFGMEFFR